MDEFEVPPSGEALALLSNETLCALLDGLETRGVDAALATKPENDIERLISLERVKVAREIRTQLKALAEGKTKRPTRGPVV